MIGIYKITNLINGKNYIGQSIDIFRRWKQEINGRCNKELKEDFLKYGLENFTFDVLIECSREELNKNEKRLIEEYNSIEQGYNKKAGGFSDNRIRYENQLEHYREYKKQWAEKNKEKVRESKKKYKLNHAKTEKEKDYNKQYNIKWNKLLCLDPFTNEIVKLSTLRGRLAKRFGSSKGVNKYILKEELD